MREDMVERLFAVFTSADRAQAIAGDLIEEREQRGWAWFWFHVARTALALWSIAVRHAPLRTLVRTTGGFALVVAPLVGGTVAAFVFPQLMGAWSALWVAGALVSGAALVAIARRLGFAASATLAMAGLVFVIACLFVIPTLAWAEQNEWKDSSPHSARSVTVDQDVQLEVLDWGGSGPALVLLAGLGDTAHVYDDLAPALTPRYRVIGVTRRAHGRSSAPLTGYGAARLAEDVARVIENAGLDKPVIVGHSFAGEEMHALAARHAAKIAGLVYVDAAFNRGDDADNAAYDAVARTLPPTPAPGPADKASFAALRAYLEKVQGFAGPEAFLRARWITNPDGTIARMWAPDAPIRQEMSREMQAAYKPYNPEPIHVSALAIYARPKSAADMMRSWYPAEDAALRERVEKLFVLQRDRVGNHIKWFERFDDKGRVAEIAGAHHLFLSNPREVVQQIDAFMASLPPR